VAVADVNGDGRPDLVTANGGRFLGSSGTVSVLLGNGNGTFHSAINFGAGTRSVSVAVADVNGDSRPDMVVANYRSANVSVLLGNGNGSFQDAVNFGVGAGPSSVAVADVNGDGRPDLVTPNAYSYNASVLLGNGNGTFQNAVFFDVGSYPSSVTVADVNGDGSPDLVVANAVYSNSVSVLLGNRNAATHLQVSAPAGATAGTPFTVTALTAGNQLDALYTGTVHFTSSDGMAGLPADYTFALRDAGSHTFTVTLNTTGSQTITATDTLTGSITGKRTVTVNAPASPPAPSRSSGQGDRAGGEAALAATLLPIPATLPADHGFVHPDAATRPVTSLWTAAGSPTIPATETARRPKGMGATKVHAAGWAAQVGQPFDPEGAPLDPAAIAAYFAHNGFARSRKRI
jgi:hypothetical protein